MKRAEDLADDLADRAEDFVGDAARHAKAIMDPSQHTAML